MKNIFRFWFCQKRNVSVFLIEVETNNMVSLICIIYTSVQLGDGYTNVIIRRVNRRFMDENFNKRRPEHNRHRIGHKP